MDEDRGNKDLVPVAWSGSEDEARLTALSNNIGPFWGNIITALTRLFIPSGQHEGGLCYGGTMWLSNIFWQQMLGRSGVSDFLGVLASFHFDKKKGALQIFNAQKLSAFTQWIDDFQGNQGNSAKMLQLDHAFLGKDFHRTLLHSQLAVYSFEELKTSLRLLSSTLGEDLPFELQMQGGIHANSVCFCPIQKEWIFFDLNNNPVEKFPANEKGIEQLASKIFEKLFSKDGYVLFDARIISALPFSQRLRQKLEILKEKDDWKRIHRLDKDKAFKSNQYNVTPLFIAAQGHHVKEVRELIAMKVKVDEVITNYKGVTILHVAAYEGNTEAVAMLINEAVSVDVAMLCGATPLFAAAQNGHVDVAKLLINAGAKVDAAEKRGVTPLHIAARNGHVEVVRFLIEARSKIDAANQDGATSLLVAAGNGHVEVVKLLIDAGANVDVALKDGETPLYVAARNGNVEVVQALIDAGANVDLAKQNGVTPLFAAVENGHVGVVRALIKAKAKFDEKVGSFLPPLHSAATLGHSEIVRELLSAGADPSLPFFVTSGRLLFDIKECGSKNPKTLARLQEFLARKKGSVSLFRRMRNFVLGETERLQVNALEFAEIYQGKDSQVYQVLTEAKRSQEASQYGQIQRSLVKSSEQIDSHGNPLPNQRSDKKMQQVVSAEYIWGLGGIFKTLFGRSRNTNKNNDTPPKNIPRRR